jgi:hypothetical protein
MKVLALLALVAYASPVAELDSIKYGVKAGTKLTYKSTTSTETEVMGSMITATLTATETHEAEAVEDGWVRLKRTTTEYKMVSDSPFGDMAPNPTGMAVSSLVAPNRKMKDWKIAARGSLTQEQADILSKSAMQEVENGLEGLVFPEGDITVGKTWELEHSPAGLGMMGFPAKSTGKVKTVYKVLEMTGDVAIIEGKTGGTFNLDMDTPQGAVAMTVKVDDTNKYTVRASDGVVMKIEASGTQTMSSADFGDFVTKVKTTTELAKN